MDTEERNTSYNVCGCYSFERGWLSTSFWVLPRFTFTLPPKVFAEIIQKPEANRGLPTQHILRVHRGPRATILTVFRNRA